MGKIYGSLIRLFLFFVFFMNMSSWSVVAKKLDSDEFIKASYGDGELAHKLSSDSTSAQKAQRDLNILKGSVELSKEQEEAATQLFLSKYNFLEVPHTSPYRKEITIAGLRRQFEKLFNTDQLEVLAKSELLDFWFKQDC